MLDCEFYESIPEHCRNGMKLYIENGELPGSFLQAVISNKLVEAFGRADSTNTARMWDYGNFLYNKAPMEAWGSEEKMLAWCERKGLKGQDE